MDFRDLLMTRKIELEYAAKMQRDGYIAVNEVDRLARGDHRLRQAFDAALGSCGYRYQIGVDAWRKAN